MPKCKKPQDELELVPMPEQQELQEKFYSALQVVDDIVLKNYIAQLHDLDVMPLDPETCKNNLKKNVRFFKITRMVYEKD